MLNNIVAALLVRLDEVRREDGQGLVEYSLILVLVSIAAIAVMPGLGTAITDTFTTVTNAL